MTKIQYKDTDNQQPKHKQAQSKVIVAEHAGGFYQSVAARGLVNGRGPTKWEGFSFPNVTLLTPSVYNKEAGLLGQPPYPTAFRPLYKVVSHLRNLIK